MKPIILGGMLLLLPSVIMVAKPVSAQQNVQNAPMQSMHYITPPTPQYLAQIQEYEVEYKAGKEALRAKYYAAAESDFQEAISVDPNGPAYLGLAEALTAEGRIAEALQAYHALFNPGPNRSWGGTYSTKAHLEYALLLNQTGQWADAVAHYNEALPNIPCGDLPTSKVDLDPNTPQPAALAAAAHVGLGLYDNWEYEPDSNTRAFQEYTTAQQIAPNWDVANYYYGYGWQQLSPAERANMGSFEQAKAALQKAVKIGKGDVKKAAQKALLVAMKIK